MIFTRKIEQPQEYPSPEQKRLALAEQDSAEYWRRYDTDQKWRDEKLKEFVQALARIEEAQGKLLAAIHDRNERLDKAYIQGNTWGNSVNERLAAIEKLLDKTVSVPAPKKARAKR